MPQHSRIRARLWLWLRPTLFAAMGVVTGIGIWYFLTGQTAPIIDEGHVVETAQAGLWGLSALVALCTIAQQPASADRSLATWLATFSLLVLLRELDLHVLLNLHFHVRLKSKWLLDPTVPLWHRMTLVWLGIGLAITLVSSLWRLRGYLKALLRCGDSGVGLMAIAFVCLVTGYVLDDLVGRGLVLGPSHSQIIEETAELLGGLAFCASSIVHWHWPLTSRMQGLELNGTPRCHQP